MATEKRDDSRKSKDREASQQGSKAGRLADDVMISTEGLSKRFGSVRALDKVSFTVRRGEVVGFLGPNGAGKSTTMRILTCYISPTAGGATVHGHDVFDEPLEVRRKIGYLPQRAPLYADMRVWDYLEFVAQVRGLDPSTFKKRMKRVVEVCGLARTLNKEIGTLSHGFRQRVGLGQALIHDPPILILDEPTSDLDPNEKAEVLKYIKEIGKDRTILLSTHNLAEVEEACARAIIISRGRVVVDGAIDDIRAKTGRVRYVLTIDENQGLKNGAPSATEVQDALTALPGADRVRELPTDETAHRFELASDQELDLRGELFRMMVDKGWLLLELRRDQQSLDAVFRDLTRGDQSLNRGEEWDEDDEDEDDDEVRGEDDDLDDEDDEDRDDDDRDDEDEDDDDDRGADDDVDDDDDEYDDEDEDDDEDDDDDEEEGR
jgi:ABC-2 type transport system ATP-binding protein